MKSFITLSLISLFLTSFNSCKDTPPGPSSQLDTTSHSFTWEITTLGDRSSSVLYDVAVINDTLAYAVGEIYVAGEAQIYNMAKWDGTAWILNRVSVEFRGDTIIPPLEGISAFSARKIWLVGSLPIFGDGNNWQMFDLRTTVDPNLSLSRAWGQSSDEMYFVGSNGSIAHFNGTTWTKIESGATADLHDIWGSPDGSEVWCSGYSSNYDRANLLRVRNGIATTLWERTGITASPPFGYYVNSLWGMADLYIAADHVYRARQWNLDQLDTMIPLPTFYYRLRGSAANNQFLVGDYSEIWHYNGANWKEIIKGSSSQPLYSVAVSRHVAIAVGRDNSSLPAKARIVLLRSQ